MYPCRQYKYTTNYKGGSETRNTRMCDNEIKVQHVTKHRRKETEHDNARWVHGEGSKDQCEESESKRTGWRMRRKKTTKINVGAGV